MTPIMALSSIEVFMMTDTHTRAHTHKQIINVT
jgi:hypothetical protein